MARETPDIEIPQHFFRALCQTAGCKELLGGFHIPAVGGTVMFCCRKCGRVSMFQNGMYGIASKSMASMKDAHAAK